MNPLHEAALRYASQGWFVFPCVPGGKEPLTQHGHKEATRDSAQIDAWWQREPNANVAVAVAPSGLVVLDIDTAEGKPGRQSLAEIDAQLPDTLTAITGRGGLHAVFVRPPDVPAQRRIGFKPGLDLIGEGYIVAAPSTLTAGGQYRWNRLVAPAPLPDVLRQAATAPRQLEKVQAVGTPIEQGNRNNALFRLGCALRDTGIGAEALARALDAENRTRFNPPLEDAEMAVIVNSVLTRVQPRRDVAAGAIVEQQIHEMFAPRSRAQHICAVAAQKEPPAKFYRTGFPEFDELSGGGFATRRVVGVVGPPSMGKSAFVTTCCLEMQKTIPVLHFSTELPRKEVEIRYAASVLGFPWRDGLKGLVPDESVAAAVTALNVWIIGCDDYDRNDPLGSLRAEACALRERTGFSPLIVVDYVQMLARGAQEQMRHKVGELTLQLRILAQELDCVIIAVFSTSRAYYGGKAMDTIRASNDPRAYLAAAKESGDIEFDCGTLIFLDVDKMVKGATKPCRAAIARCRDGDEGFIGMRANLATGAWVADQTALAELEAEAHKARREENSLDDACRRLLEALPQMPNRPWGEIQKTCGIKSWTWAQKARDKLLADGVIAERKVTGYDENRRPLKGTTYVIIREETTSPAPALVPGDIDDANPE